MYDISEMIGYIKIEELSKILPQLSYTIKIHKLLKLKLQLLEQDEDTIVLIYQHGYLMFVRSILPYVNDRVEIELISEIYTS